MHPTPEGPQEDEQASAGRAGEQPVHDGASIAPQPAALQPAAMQPAALKRKLEEDEEEGTMSCDEEEEPAKRRKSFLTRLSDAGAALFG